MKPFFLILPLLLTVSLSACQTMNPRGTGNDTGPMTPLATGDCPAVSRVAELASIYQFVTPPAPTPDTKISEGHITRVDMNCGTSGDALILDVTLGVDGAVGPRGRTVASEKPHFIYPFFVTLIDPQNNILFKDIHAVSLNYDAGLNQSRQIETLKTRVRMDSLKGIPPKNMRLLVGFQLNTDEIAYNRTLPSGELGKSIMLSGDRTVMPPKDSGAISGTNAPPMPQTTQSTIETLKKGH